MHDGFDARALIVLREIKDLLADINESARSNRVDPDELLSTEQAASLCGVHKKVILRWAKIGLPFYDMGKGLKFNRRELSTFSEGFHKQASLRKVS